MIIIWVKTLFTCECNLPLIHRLDTQHSKIHQPLHLLHVTHPITYKSKLVSTQEHFNTTACTRLHTHARTKARTHIRVFLFIT